MHSSQYPGPVCTSKEWWSDDVDNLHYGVNIHGNRTVHETLAELHRVVPRVALHSTQCENCDYCNYALESKDCYLVFGNIRNESCCFGHIVWRSDSCFDCLYTYESELCYECTDCVRCYNVTHSIDVENCTDCQFLINCTNCTNCFGCVGLHNKEYHFFNQPIGKADYERRIKETPLTRSGISNILAQVRQLQENLSCKYYHGFSNEHVSGDYIYFSKNLTECFDVKRSEDSAYLGTVDVFQNSYDCSYSPGPTELCYECLTVQGYHLIGCHACLHDCSNLLYCDQCYSCKDCFGCVGLKNKQYCIFNKQYSEEDYYEKVAQLIESMQASGDWGEFFPVSLSPFGYNETQAQEFFPLTKEDAQKQGYSWKEPKPIAPVKSPYTPPESIHEVNDSVCSQVLLCSSCKKGYRITQQELHFYRQAGVPLPDFCFFCRHKTRTMMRNPRVLWKRECTSCKKTIPSSYAPARPEQILCEQCYHSNVL